MGWVVQWARSTQLKPNLREFKISSHSPTHASYLPIHPHNAHIFVSLHAGFLFADIYIIYLIFPIISFISPPPPFFVNFLPLLLSFSCIRVWSKIIFVSRFNSKLQTSRLLQTNVLEKQMNSTTKKRICCAVLSGMSWLHFARMQVYNIITPFVTGSRKITLRHYEQLHCRKCPSGRAV
jgi:hypothetical protein